jgi:hypothetical protein
MGPHPSDETQTQFPAPPPRRPQDTSPQDTSPQDTSPQDTSLGAYVKWSALMVAVVLGLGFVAAQVLRWLDIDLGR